MASVFKRLSDGNIRELSSIRCKNETRELQDVLENTPSLLSGEQINPDDPRRWLLVQREMPVPDPNSGQDRWSLDFLYLDQSAVLTLVECKRYDDTRSRREVIGQVFEYAANAQFYWTGDELRQHAEESARSHGKTLEEAISLLRPDDELTSEAASDIFERAILNLKEGVVRIIFFLDQAPRELKCLADFLNSQMSRAEILVVEAKQYGDEGGTIIVPRLFGFTEQVRRSKEQVRVTPAARSQGRKWDEASFFADAATRVSEQQIKAIQTVYEHAKRTADLLTWGKGANRGSFNPKVQDICPRALYTVYSNGSLQLNFGHITGSENADIFRKSFFDSLKQANILPLDEDAIECFPSFEADLWTPHLENILAITDKSIDLARKSK